MTSNFYIALRQARRCLRATFGLLGLAWFAAAALAATDDFLDPEQAFRLNARALDAQQIELRFDIAPGYVLYREKFSVEGAPAGSALQMPRGKVKYDETFQKNVEIFREQAVMTVKLPAAPSAQAHWVVVNQGCADQGLCYPPTQRVVRIDTADGQVPRVTMLSGRRCGRLACRRARDGDNEARATGRCCPFGGRDKRSPLGECLRLGAAVAQPDAGGRRLLDRRAAVVVHPLRAADDPHPVVDHRGPDGNRFAGQGLLVALAYSLGMALVYTGFGMLAGLMGEGLSAALQNAWVLGAFALLLAGLSLSMFGVYELQMPSAVQSRVTQWSGRLNGGQHAGVFVMGGLSALIVGPAWPPLWPARWSTSARHAT